MQKGKKKKTKEKEKIQGNDKATSDYESKISEIEREKVKNIDRFI